MKISRSPLRRLFSAYYLQSRPHRPRVVTSVFARLRVCSCVDLPFKSGCEGNLVHLGRISHRQSPQLGPSPNLIQPVYYTEAMARNQYHPPSQWTGPSPDISVVPGMYHRGCRYRGFFLRLLCNSVASWASSF